MRVLITGDRSWGLFSRLAPAHGDLREAKRAKGTKGPEDSVVRKAKLEEATALCRALSTLDPERDFVILGDAEGADEFARSFCEKLGLPYRVHEANWAEHHRAAGPIRNRAMLDDLGQESLTDPEPREVWWFHRDLENSKGTKNCVEQARARGLTIRNGMEVG